MKRIFLLVCMLTSGFLLTSCNEAVSIGIIGGDDGTTSIFVSEQKDNIKRMYDVDRYFRENYIDERKLPILDIHIENPFVSEDRTLILDDSIENNIELMIYEYYQNQTSGAYQKIKDMIIGDLLTIATENEEKNFKDGIYFSKITLDEIELVDEDDLDEITESNKQRVIETLNDLEMEEFAIVEVEKTVKLNEKFLSMAPQVSDGEITRYYLLGKKDNAYKIVEVYWEDFMLD